MSSNIHFLYEDNKQESENLVSSFISALGQTDIETADTIVSVGGDGMLLQALRQGIGKKVCGVVPPQSNSQGFWTNRDIHTPEKLTELLGSSKIYPIKPLRARLQFEDGSDLIRYGYNDISVQGRPQKTPRELKDKFGLTDMDLSVQSILVSLRTAFTDAALGPARIMGSGLIFSTPFGSTAMNRTYGGPSVDIRDQAIALTGMGITEPKKGFTPISNNDKTVFEVGVESPIKRPVIVTFDSFGIAENEAGSPIRSVKISSAKDRTSQLVLNDNPRTRAYSALGMQ